MAPDDDETQPGWAAHRPTPVRTRRLPEHRRRPRPRGQRAADTSDRRRLGATIDDAGTAGPTGRRRPQPALDLGARRLGHRWWSPSSSSPCVLFTQKTQPAHRRDQRRSRATFKVPELRGAYRLSCATDQRSLSVEQFARPSKSDLVFGTFTGYNVNRSACASTTIGSAWTSPSTTGTRRARDQTLQRSKKMATGGRAGSRTQRVTPRTHAQTASRESASSRSRNAVQRRRATRSGFSNCGEWPASAMTTSCASGMRQRPSAESRRGTARPGHRPSRASGVSTWRARRAAVGLGASSVAIAAPHHDRQRLPLARPGTPGSPGARPAALIRGRAERVESTELLQRILALRRARRRAPYSISSGSMPVTGPGRRVHQHERLDALRVCEHHPASDHPTHRMAEQPEPLEPAASATATCRRQVDRASTRRRSSGPSLSP